MAEKLAYCWKKPGNSLLYFRRRIPEDIKPLLIAAGSPHARKSYVIVSLKTSNPKLAALRIPEFVHRTNRQWDLLRDPMRVDAMRQAYELLRQHGVNPVDPEADEAALVRFYKALAQALPASTRKAIDEAGERPVVGLIECLSQYVAARPSTEKHALLAFGYLLKYFGRDRDIRRVRRRHVNEFVAFLLSGGHSTNGTPIHTSTVARYLNVLQAAFGRAIRENELGIRNVFIRVEIPNKGADVQKRRPFSGAELQALHVAIDEWVASKGWDQLRCILTVLAETGARLAEVVGLAAADIHLDERVSFIELTRHRWRPLKTSGSARNIPLTPRAVVALKAAQGLRGESSFAFPRYTTEEKCAAGAVSVSLTAWIRSRDGLGGTNLGNHNLRHTVRDLLRAAKCPDEAADQLFGHRTPGMGARYGRGYPLETLAEWLVKATAPVHT